MIFERLRATAGATTCDGYNDLMFHGMTRQLLDLMR